MKLANTDVAVQAEEDAIFKQLASSGSYLPRFQFYSSSSEIVKSGEFPQNHYGLVKGKDDVTDLGKDVEVVPVAVRAKALDLRTGDVLSYFDFKSEQFQTVLALSDVKDSKCMAGTEFLFWIPSESEFCTFFAYNKSSKQEAGKLRAMINKPVTMKSVFVKRPENSFQAIKAIESSLVPENLPEQELLDKTVAKFKNPTDSAASAVTGADAAATTRAQ